MLVSTGMFVVITLATMISLCIIIGNPLLAGVISFVLLMCGYMVIAVYKQKRRSNLIEKYCDPDAFIEATEKQRKVTGRNKKLNTYLDIDMAVGLMLLGDYKSAQVLLLEVDKTKLSRASGAFLVYSVNRIACLYGLGEREAADALYEKQVPLLAPVTKNQRLTMRLLIAFRLQEKGSFMDAKKAYEQLLREKLTVRQRAGVLFNLAELDEHFDEQVMALEKYREVARIGNSLWIAEQARQKIACNNT